MTEKKKKRELVVESERAEPRYSPDLRGSFFSYQRKTKRAIQWAIKNEQEINRISSTLFVTFSNRMNFEMIILVREYAYLTGRNIGLPHTFPDLRHGDSTEVSKTYCPSLVILVWNVREKHFYVIFNF